MSGTNSDWDDASPRRRDDDYDDLPPRRRRFDDDYDDGAAYDDVRQRVQAPGMALMVVGLIGILCSLGFIVLGGVMVAGLADRPRVRNDDDEVLGIVLL